MEKARFKAGFFVTRAARLFVTGRSDGGDNFCHFMTQVGTHMAVIVPIDYVRPKM